MQTRTPFAWLASSIIAITLCAGGCPGTAGTSGTNGTSDDSTSLTTTEQTAAKASADAAEALAQAFNTTQSPTGAEVAENQSSLEIPLGTKSLHFGSCPAVSMTASNDGTISFGMTVDFGSGCAPYGTEGYTCSGSASGTFSQRNKSINLTFQNISCAGDELTGSVDATYDRTSTTVTLTGTWSLTATDAAGSVSTAGTGNGDYNLSNYTTTIDAYTGTLTIDTGSFTTTMTGIKMSFPTYSAYMPYAGTITLSGNNIRTFVVTFTENSPSTGVVQVSINGAPAISVDLYSL